LKFLKQHTFSCPCTLHDTQEEGRYVVQLILNLSTKLSSLVCFMPQPLYFQDKSPGSHWMEDWVAQRLSTLFTEGINLWCLPRTEKKYVSAHVLTDPKKQFSASLGDVRKDELPSGMWRQSFGEICCLHLQDLLGENKAIYREAGPHPHSVSNTVKEWNINPVWKDKFHRTVVTKKIKVWLWLFKKAETSNVGNLRMCCVKLWLVVSGFDTHFTLFL
jgi:hypothetical protein